ncbi:MAG: bi-domain-containing oxidoreductase [Pirellulaceae bacterium]
MKQIVQNLRNGIIHIDQIPTPAVQRGEVLVANQASLVSAGTEKSMMELAKRSLLGKARERPDQFRRVLEKIRSEGLYATVQQVQTKLDEPIAMGYSSAGIVVACGDGVQDFKPGDHVATNGPHAEVVSVPTNLSAHIPNGVSMECASFGVLGSIALQGVRLSRCQLGETVFVIGLGLVGQLTVALLSTCGAKVVGTDLDAARCELAARMGASIARPGIKPSDVESLTGGLGADAVIVAASTKSNAPLELACHAVRKKGRIVLVGVVGLNFDRRPMYFKEAEFVVSCSYGPGRYDADYESRGIDYPAPYVRWTEQRNIQFVLDLMGQGKLDVGPLITHRFEIEQAEQAYELIERGTESYLGIVVRYPELSRRQDDRVLHVRTSRDSNRSGLHVCGIIGAGNFARMVMLPIIRNAKALRLKRICSAHGVTAAHAAKSFGIEQACSSEREILDDPDIGTVFSFTRHDQHANQVIESIRNGKNIFVEKPLCLRVEELVEIEAARGELGDSAPLVMVGFNRRFSPAAYSVRQFFMQMLEPMTVSIRFNAGEIPADHWTQHDLEGGGRIIGEACHAIDLATYLTGSLPVRVFAESVSIRDPGRVSDDQCFITLRHANGSVSSIGYLAGGDKAFPKERVEVFGGGRVAVIDDFRSVTTCVSGRMKTQKMRRDKGHAQEIAAWVAALSGKTTSPIPWHEIRAVTWASILAIRSLREGIPCDIPGTVPL